MTGTTSNWRQVDALFRQALETDGDPADWARKHLADQPALRDEVLALLSDAVSSEAAIDDMLSRRDGILDEALDDPAPAGGGLVGKRIGPFVVTDMIARGGMGVVYRATRADGGWQQTVAIKILPSWAGDEAMMARLRTERQILSSLQHPAIPPLLDGGETDDGYPYFVTEFIDGETITDYVDRHRLPLGRRLDLFCEIADAVHHAHTKLVIHRDIKPSNILVDGDGRPHLLDFGIAKPLDADTHGDAALTVHGFSPMTLKFASPEQMLGEGVTTASDVYQLGLLLHRLVTGEDATRGADGSKTLRRATRDSIRRAAGDGPRLSDRLGNDRLATIIGKALRAEPGERYPSAAGLAADVRRYLRGDAITARPESALETLRRMARRNPAGALLASIVFVLLAGWLASLQLYSSQLKTERDFATRQATRAERVKEVLTDIYRRQDPLQADTVADRPASMIESLDIAVATTDRELAGEPDIRAELYRLFATLYYGAGASASALDMLQRASALSATLGAEFLPMFAETEAELGYLLRGTDRERAMQHYDRALATVPELRGTSPASAVSVLLNVADGEIAVGRRDEALVHYDRALAVYEAEGVDAPGLLIDVLYGYGNTLVGADRLAASEPLLLRALEVSEQEYGPDHMRSAGVLDALSSLERNRANLDRAIAYSNRVVAIMTRNRADNFDDLLSARNNLALALGKAKRYEESISMFRDVISLYESNSAGSAELAKTIKNLASILHMAGDYEAALVQVEKAGRMMRDYLPADSVYQATPVFTKALIYLDSGRLEQAEAAARSSLDMLLPLLGERHYQIHVNRCVLGEAMIRQGRIEAGLALARPAMAALRASGTRVARYEERCAAALAL